MDNGEAPEDVAWEMNFGETVIQKGSPDKWDHMVQVSSHLEDVAGAPIKFQKWQQREIQSDGYETICWGCGLRLSLPSFVPVFKCAWCGAITRHDVQAKNGRRCIDCSRAADRVFVTIVFILIFLIICGGSWAVFPVLFPNFGFGFYFHSVLTGILAFNTLFNYCIAAFAPAGPPPQLVWGDFKFVRKGALEGHGFCNFCKKPKPPGAHHCRSCKACVLEMDHHCPFIGNCVGAANQRPFILFLLFTVISNVYVLLMSIYAGLKIWPTVLGFNSGLEVTSTGWHITDVLVSHLQALLGSSATFSVRALALMYLVAASLSVIIGVGLLLYQQLRLLYDGHTYIDSLQFDNGVYRGVASSRGWKNLHGIFGYGHPIFWVFPKLGSADISGKKVHEK